MLFKYDSQKDFNNIEPGSAYRSENSLAREAVWESGLYENWKESVNAVLVPTQFRGEELLANQLSKLPPLDKKEM